MQIWQCPIYNMNKNVKETVRFLTRKVFDSDKFSIASFKKRKAQVTFVEKPQEIIKV